MAAQPSSKDETLCVFCEIHPEKGGKWACDAENLEDFSKLRLTDGESGVY